MAPEVPGFETLGAVAERVTRLPWSAYPAPIRAAVDAYDERRRIEHGPGTAPMSDANKITIAPMVMAAVRAFFDANQGASA